MNRVRECRSARGWSQEELARRSGLSRAGVSAIETGRLVPSAAAALRWRRRSGAGSRTCSRSLAARRSASWSWAWEPARTPCRYWQAEVSGRIAVLPRRGRPRWESAATTGSPGRAGPCEARGGSGDPDATLVMACCDPAVGLLAPALAPAGVRLLALPSSSRAALGCWAGAGPRRGSPPGPPRRRPRWRRRGERLGAVREAAGAGVRAAPRGDVGGRRGVGPGRRIGSVGEAVRSGLRWVGREPGSGARPVSRRVARTAAARRRRLALDHRGVAEAVRAGWADAGVCLRLAGEEAGLGLPRRPPRGLRPLLPRRRSATTQGSRRW